MVEDLSFLATAFFISGEWFSINVRSKLRVPRKVILVITVFVSFQTLWLEPVVEACHEGVVGDGLASPPPSCLVSQSDEAVVPLDVVLQSENWRLPTDAISPAIQM